MPSQKHLDAAEELSDPYPDCTHPEHEGLAALVDCRRKTNTARIASALASLEAQTIRELVEVVRKFIIKTTFFEGASKGVYIPSDELKDALLSYAKEHGVEIK